MSITSPSLFTAPPHASVSALHEVLLGNYFGAADSLEGDTFPLDPFENQFIPLK